MAERLQAGGAHLDPPPDRLASTASTTRRKTPRHDKLRLAGVRNRLSGTSCHRPGRRSPARRCSERRTEMPPRKRQTPPFRLRGHRRTWPRSTLRADYPDWPVRLLRKRLAQPKRRDGDDRIQRRTCLLRPPRGTRFVVAIGCPGTPCSRARSNLGDSETLVDEPVARLRHVCRRRASRAEWMQRRIEAAHRVPSLSPPLLRRAGHGNRRSERER